MEFSRKKYYWSTNENIWKPIQAFQNLDWHENYNACAVYLENNKMLIMDAISEIEKNNQAISTDYTDTEQL